MRLDECAEYYALRRRERDARVVRGETVYLQKTLVSRGI